MARHPERATFTERLSRRRLISRAGVGSAGVMAASLACSRYGGRSASQARSASSQTAKSASSGKQGGVLSYAGGTIGSFDLAGRTFDPHIQTQSGSRSYGLFYDRLLVYNLVTFEVEAQLAQKWEQPSQTEYVFHLPPNVKWQNKPPVNGRPMTTDDVLWSLERARTDDPKFYSRSLLTLVDTVEAPDKSTIRLTTTSPDASTLKKLATDNLAVLSREVFEKYPKPNTAEAAVGTGAFIMESEEDSVGATYVRNPEYWRPGQPYLDGFRTKQFPDTQTAWAAFLAGQIDIAVLSGPEVKAYLAQQGPGYTPAWGSDDTHGSFMYPNLRAKPLDDARVTRALRLLTDHDEFVSAWAQVQTGRGEYGSLFPPALAAWDLKQAEYKDHLEWKQPKDEAAKEAIALLSAAGFSKSSPLRFTVISGDNPEGRSGLQLLQAQWKRLSQDAVDVDIKFLAGTAGDAARANRTFAYAMYGHSAGPVDPEIWLSTTYCTGGSLNFAGFSDPQLDAMIDKQRGIFDEIQRKAAVREIILYMIDHGPTTVAAGRYFLHAVKPKVQGYAPETHYLNGRQYAGIWLSV